MNKDDKVLITGGTGFLGRRLFNLMEERGYKHVAISGRRYDLTSWDRTSDIFDQTEPAIVFHLAAVVGGIGANRANPGRFWFENTVMGVNVLEMCHVKGVRKLVLVGTTCSYPKYCEVPFKETDLWAGYPEETNAPYGIAKKNLMIGAQAYAAEYGMDVCLPVPTNLYGPGDHYDLERSHVIPAMMRKFHEAKVGNKGAVELWGTGLPTRDFLYVDDAARGILQVAEWNYKNQPINLGSGREVSMRELAETIRRVVGFEGAVSWNTSKPDGQPRRQLDTTTARAIGWAPAVDFEEGLKRTYQDFVSRWEIGAL